MAATTYHRPDDIDLRALWQGAVRSLPRLALIAAVLAAATYGLLGLFAPQYVSETQLAIESKSTTNPFADPSRSGASDNVGVRMDKEAVNTHVRALMSMDLGEEIVREMKLWERPEFNSARGAPDKWSALLRLVGIGAPRASETDQDRALDAYFKRLEVYSPKESRFIGVRFTSMDPELAAAVANRIAENYRVNLAHQSLIETDEVQKALAPKIERLAEEAAAAEAAVETFRGEANIFKGGGQQATGLNEQQLAELNAELSKVKAARSEAEARAKQAREMQELGSAETLADVQKSPLIQSLVQSRVRVERQISELSATLLPGHPRMRQLTADLKGLKGQIAAEVAKIVDGLDKEAKVAALREDAIQKSVADIKTRIVSAGPEEAKLRSLEADAKSKRAELDRLRAQYEANRVRSDDSRAIPVEAQIVSSARPSTVPVFPRRTASALLVAVATMMIGLALVITRGLLGGARIASARTGRAERRNERRRQERTPPVLSVPASVQPKPQAPQAPPSPPVPSAVLPQRVEPVEAEQVKPPAQIEEPQVAAMQAPVGPAAPSPVEAPLSAVAGIATHDAMADRIEQLRKGGLSGTRTLITGSADVFSLAREAADVCRRLADRGLTVIMVDYSLNGSGVAEPLGQPAWPGFNELVDGRARFEDVVRSLRDSEVHLIPCGRGLDDADEPLDADSINFLLDALDDVYEHIVVVARTEPARRLFEAIQGRFDCGVTIVTGATQKARVRAEGAGSFLGFEVDGIALFALDSSEGQARGRQRLARAG
ncbi:exopolysaccharide transport family protein [Hyphomicrobium sp.]|uniref:GumC family protein n=1 Tax=Hyphomicrobium sp. TaxID=82 RepID=UPI0025BAF7B9|nr:exopolysaccharide transport family protein [Hyphomicrobium sp.]MCC7254159.1 lipopolysaccharide biosynthesis protein [Hyphomicrobium sp.]